MFQNFLKQKQNFSIESKNFGTKPKGFDMFQNFLKQFFLQVLKQFFLQVLLQSLLALSWPLLASATLSRPQLTFSGTFSSLSRPLKHLKASIDTPTASTDTLTASTDTLTASKAPVEVV